MKAKTFDRQFDSGADVIRELDLQRARRPGQHPRRVNVDFPQWVIESLDKEARRMGVTRQSVIKIWVAERLRRSAATAGQKPGPRGGSAIGE